MRRAVTAIKESREKAAVKIQSWMRGVRIRSVTKFGLGYDEELASMIKAIVDQHELKPGPNKYENRPRFKDVCFRKFFV